MIKEISQELETLTATYNTYRLRNQSKKLSRTEVLNIFKAIGFPIHSTFRKYAIENKLLLKQGTSRNCYFYFPTEPVHWTSIEKTIQDSRKEICLNKKKSTAKITIEDAVALLKEHGYRIMKPTFVEV